VTDTAVALYGMDTTGSITMLNGVATGTDFTNRIGRKVVWKSFLVQGHSIPQDASVSPNLGRVMIIYDTQPNGALPAMTDVLVTADATSPLQLNNRDRFRVLWDKRVVNGVYADAATQATADQTIKEIRKYKKCNLQTIYDGTTAAIADIQSGCIFLLTIGTQASGASYNARLNIRLRFNDA